MPCPRPPNPPGAAGHAAAATTTMENDPIDFQEMATEQENCAETQKLISGPKALTISFQAVGEHQLDGDISTGTWRPLVPLGHRRAVFNHIHNITHPGTLATKRLLCLSGQESIERSLPGPRTALSASSPKSTDTSRSNPSQSLFRNAGSPTSTSIWLAH